MAKLTPFYSYAIPDTTEVKIHVLDLNDNAPRFILDSYQKVISENATVDSQILRVTATDADSGTNGQVHYSLLNGNVNNTFELDNKDGLLKLQQRLTRPSVPNFFNLTISATDHGIPPLTSKFVFVYLKILRPIPKCSEKGKLSFPLAVYLGNVNESAPLRTPILHVRANIGKCAPRARVNYLLSGLRDPDVDKHFVVQAETGAIELIKPLDYEVRTKYSFHVSAVGKANKIHKVNLFPFFFFFESSPNSTRLLCFVTGKDTLPSQCGSPPRCINGYLANSMLGLTL